MSERNSSNPNTRHKLTRRGRIAAGIAGLGLAAGAYAGIDALQAHDDNEHDKGIRPQEESSIIYADHDTKKVKVRSGEGVDQVIQRAYGIDAPEGMNQVVQNNPEYTAQYQAVVEANGGSEELQPGKLPLPVEFYTQEEVDQMQSNNQ